MSKVGNNYLEPLPPKHDKDDILEELKTTAANLSIISSMCRILLKALGEEIPLNDYSNLIIVVSDAIEREERSLSKYDVD